MLTQKSQFGSLDCQGYTRRDFLRIGALGLGGLSLPGLLAARQCAAGQGYAPKHKSVILLFLCGGASQFETFDPKMDVPDSVRTMTGEVKTCLPGVTFAGTFEHLAQCADKLAVVRSFAPHGISDHRMAIHKVLRAGFDNNASIGAATTLFYGASHPGIGMPNFAELLGKEVDPEYRQDEERMREGNGPGGFGANYAPFAPGGNGQIDLDMRLNIPSGRFDDRRRLLAALDRLEQRLETSTKVAALHGFQQQAVELILGKKAREAMDLSREDPRVVEAYDTSKFNMGFQKMRPSDIGHRLLVARRLCEAGCGFITVGSAGWDHHANDKHSGMVDGLRKLGRPLDKAVSAFLEDVERRGLSDDILLVITSEFGRTPKINKKGGRDHWPALCPLVFAGGGLKMGQVVGDSTRMGEEPKSNKLGFDQLLGTIWHSLFELGELRVRRGLPRELQQVVERVSPIPQLV